MRRAAARLVAQGLRAAVQEAQAASSSSGWVVQACAPARTPYSSSIWSRTWHNGSIFGTCRPGGGQGALPAAARAAAQQGRTAATTHAWRLKCWQQIRQQWTDGRGYQHFGRGGDMAAAIVYNERARRRAFTITAIIGGGWLIIWASSRQEVPYTKRKHAIIVSPETEAELGQQTFQQVLAEARATGSLMPATHRATQAVRRVGMRVAQAATDGFGGGFQGHLQHLEWEFAVIDSPQVNAFVVPGGKVVVYTGLLRLVGNEDELAAVLAHESAHVVARHAAERITQAGALEVARMVAYWVFGLPIPAGPLTAIFFLPNSRKAETEADVIGLQIMSRACYDPTGMVTVFEKMGKAEKEEGADIIPKFLRTHPTSNDRIKAIEKMLPTAAGLWEMSGCEAARGPLARLQGLLRNVDWGG